MLQTLCAAPKRPRGPLSSQSQTPNAGPPSPTAQTMTGPTQGITQQPLSQQLLSMTPSTQTQGSQDQPLPNQDLLSIAPLTSQPWVVYNEDPWVVGLPAFSAAAAEQLLQQTHSGTGMQIPLQGVKAHWFATMHSLHGRAPTCMNSTTQLRATLCVKPTLATGASLALALHRIVSLQCSLETLL